MVSRACEACIRMEIEEDTEPETLFVSNIKGKGNGGRRKQEVCLTASSFKIHSVLGKTENNL